MGQQFRNKITGSTITPPASLRSRYTDHPRWEPVDMVAVDDLKGAKLDAALDANDLPKSGTVAEKKARLAEFLAAAEEFGYVDQSTTE